MDTAPIRLISTTVSFYAETREENNCLIRLEQLSNRNTNTNIYLLHFVLFRDGPLHRRHIISIQWEIRRDSAATSNS